MLQGTNRSDDLFLYVKRQFGPVDRIVPTASYRLRHSIGCLGIQPRSRRNSTSVGVCSRLQRWNRMNGWLIARTVCRNVAALWGTGLVPDWIQTTRLILWKRHAFLFYRGVALLGRR